MAKKKVFQISNALTEGLEDTITAAHHYAGELRVDIIPIKRIEVDPQNPRDLALSIYDVHHGIEPEDPLYDRKKEELEQLQTIANSIKEQGIINPILVYKLGERYRLIAGERRTLATVLAGKAEIQAKILDSRPTELKISLLQWIENVERNDLSLWERVYNLEKIIAQYALNKGKTSEEITITELSNLIGCTKPHAMNYKAVLLANETIKQLIKENKIKNLEKAAVIATAESKHQSQLIEACLAGLPLKKMKLLVAAPPRSPKLVAVPPQKKRGRQSIAVNFGTTKNVKVAQLILNSILEKHPFEDIDLPLEINWADFKDITEAFRFIVKQLEKVHA